jgi:hypothetical protein
VLAAVTEILRENLRDLDGEPAYNITFISENILNLSAFTRGGAFFHVRVKERGELPGEYENFCNAWRSFPRYAPQPLGRYFKDGREIIVVRGIRHQPVSAGSIANDKHALVRKIIEFFETVSLRAKAPRPTHSHRTYLRQLQERISDPASAAILQDWIATDRVDDLPQIGQHGDFVLSNLGLTDIGMVVFDWEDFEQVAFPGLDLCTLLMSDMELRADRLRAMINGEDALSAAYAKLLDKSCPSLGLTPDLFRKLIPLYLVIFLDLKRNYGTGIRQLVSKIIYDIQRQVV